MKNRFTLQAGGSSVGLFTFQAVPTQLWQAFVITLTLSTMGTYHYRAYGQTAFIHLLAASGVGAAVASGLGIQFDPTQCQSGALGISAGITAYTCMRSLYILRRLRFMSAPLFIGSLMYYGIHFNDHSVLGGTAGALALFFAGL